MPWATPMAWSHRSKCTAVVSARSTSPHMCSVELMSPGSISSVAIRLQAPPSAVTLTASTECPLVAYVSTHSGNGAILRNTLPGTSALFLRDTEPLDVSAPPGLTGQVSPPDAVQAASHTEETARASSQDAEQPGSQTPQQKADSTALSLSLIGPRQSTALPLPLVHRTTIQEILERSHWHDLLQSSELQTELLHHCPFCRQWCMDTAAIKRHMMQQHAEWVEAFFTVVSHLTPLRSRTMVFPCRYCGQTQVNKLKHHERSNGGNTGNVCPRETLLRGSLPLFASSGSKEGEGRRNSGSQEGQVGSGSRLEHSCSVSSLPAEHPQGQGISQGAGQRRQREESQLLDLGWTGTIKIGGSRGTRIEARTCRTW